MKKNARRWISIVSIAIVTLYAPQISAGVDRLIWRASGTIEAISVDSLTVNRFAYKLTSTTVYEKNDRQTTRSAFSVGDHVKVTFITDRSVVQLEGESTSGHAPGSTPTPAATPQVTRLTAKLTPLGNSIARGDGVSSYSETERALTLRIKVPRNTIPLATTDAEAKDLSVTASITRHGDLVATCSTAFEPKRQKRSVYEFKVQIKKTGRSRARAIKGKCVLANGATGIPTVHAGDLVTVSEATAGEFLTGIF
jgi:hypothetical protein